MKPHTLASYIRSLRAEMNIVVNSACQLPMDAITPEHSLGVSYRHLLGQYQTAVRAWRQLPRSVRVRAVYDVHIAHGRSRLYARMAAAAHVVLRTP